MVDDAMHRARITTPLCAMRRATVILRHEVLQGGISGASTYRVHLPGEQVMLKITDEDSPAYVRERARREVFFYRDLAHHIPLRIPAVLDSAAGASATWLCLVSYEPAPPIGTWTEQQYLEIARQLGEFHAAFWDSTQQLSDLPWLRLAMQSTDPTDILQAADAWHALAQQPRFRDILTPVEMEWIESLMHQVARLDVILRDFPMTLCHGDCHHGNLLLDADDEWLWADWQEAGIGRGPEDLSFFFQVARAAGGAVPEAAAIKAYHQRLEASIGQRIALSDVKRVIDAPELRTLLLLWPPFLAHMSSRQLADMLRRLRHLAEELDAYLSAIDDPAIQHLVTRCPS